VYDLRDGLVKSVTYREVTVRTDGWWEQSGSETD